MYGKGIGGAELQFLELVDELAKRHQIRLVSLGGDGAVKAIKLPETVELKTYHYDQKLSALLGLGWAWIGNLGYGAHAIVSTSFFSNVLGLVFSIFGRKRLVSLQTVSKAMRYSALDRFVLRQFDVLVAGSSDIRNYLLGHGQNSERIKVVNNWVDFSSREITADTATTRAKFGLGQNDTVIGCIGRMHNQKGQEFLIRAFRDLKQCNPGLRLVLVGDGPTMAAMQKEASDLGNSVIFTGSVVGDNYNNLMNMFDIYVQPSRFEGLPRTLLDAMYLRKPIVATAVNGNLDAIQDGKNGLLVPAEQTQAIVIAVQAMLDDREWAKQLGKQACQDAEKNFDMNQQLQRIESILG